MAVVERAGGHGLTTRFPRIAAAAAVAAAAAAALTAAHRSRGSGLSGAGA